jgi:hypothetical protein
VSEIKTCEICGKLAEVYAVGKYAGDWGGRYCLAHIPVGFMIIDTLNKKETEEAK